MPSASASASTTGRKRGRRQDDSLPPSRSREIQRAFRARRAALLDNLTARVAFLSAENAELRRRLGLPEDGPSVTGKTLVLTTVNGETPGADVGAHSLVMSGKRIKVEDVEEEEDDEAEGAEDAARPVDDRRPSTSGTSFSCDGSPSELPLPPLPFYPAVPSPLVAHPPHLATPLACAVPTLPSPQTAINTPAANSISFLPPPSHPLPQLPPKTASARHSLPSLGPLPAPGLGLDAYPYPSPPHPLYQHQAAPSLPLPTPPIPAAPSAADVQAQALALAFTIAQSHPQSHALTLALMLGQGQPSPSPALPAVSPPNALQALLQASPAFSAPPVSAAPSPLASLLSSMQQQPTPPSTVAASPSVAASPCCTSTPSQPSPASTCAPSAVSSSCCSKSAPAPAPLDDPDEPSKVLIEGAAGEGPLIYNPTLCCGGLIDCSDSSMFDSTPSFGPPEVTRRRSRMEKALGC
ncbi:hypothetical protein JCM6882_004070 [Rhodosporidiobolus microsporus]